MYKHARGFRGSKPSGFGVKKPMEIGIVGHIPPEGFPPVKSKGGSQTPKKKKKKVKIRSASDTLVNRARAENIRVKLKRRMAGVIVERKIK